ncbi:MAG TPA: 30S ribosomal protein S17 [Blastocatellia bacterium]|nr:30S ribosomal protein S17 [Blastocatellia bacterium]
MEENKEETPVETEEQQGEGLLVEAARAVGSALGKVVAAVGGPDEAEPPAERKRRRQEKVGLVTSDKMEKTVVVRVERQVRHPKYKRYIRKRSKFMAHDELGAGIGDTVRIIETRPLSARKRWRVVEIMQKAR